MKRIALIIGLVASLGLLAGCAHKCMMGQNTMPASSAGHDYKGELK